MYTSISDTQAQLRALQSRSSHSLIKASGLEWSLHTVEPLRQPHRHSIILLHGSGDSGPNFGSFLLTETASPPAPLPSSTSTSTSSSSLSSIPASGPGEQTLAELFPHARFIFPGARRRVCARFDPLAMTRWFDWWSLEDLGERAEIQREGLWEGAGLVRELLRREIAAVGARNVVLGGLSNGCGMSLAGLLLWEAGDGERLAGYVGMCGWLPYADRIAGMESLGAAAAWLRREIAEDGEGEEVVGGGKERGAAAAAAAATPVFLGHGDDDATVPVERCEDATVVMRGMGFEVEKRIYPGLGHWYSADMLRDIANFLDTRLPEGS